MTPAARNYAVLLVAWSRTLEKHGLSFEEWLEKRAAGMVAALNH